MYQTEKNLNEFGDKLGEDDKKELQEAAESLKKANSGSNVDDIKSAMEKLNQTWSKHAQNMYADAQGDAQPSDAGQPSEEPSKKKKDKGDGEIEDADFEVVD